MEYIPIFNTYIASFTLHKSSFETCIIQSNVEYYINAVLCDLEFLLTLAAVRHSVGGGGGGDRGTTDPPGYMNLLKFGQMGCDIRAFRGRKKIIFLKNNNNMNKNNDKLV